MARPKKVIEPNDISGMTNDAVVVATEEEEELPVSPAKQRAIRKVEVAGDLINSEDPYEQKEEKQERVRIRMRVDHQCTIAMKRYSFKKGKCYDVPPNVKSILGKRGLLDPL